MSAEHIIGLVGALVIIGGIFGWRWIATHPED